MTTRFFNPDGTYEDKEDTDELKDLYVQDAINLPKQQWEVFRRERNRRLAETDYLALSDTVEMSDDPEGDTHHRDMVTVSQMGVLEGAMMFCVATQNY